MTSATSAKSAAVSLPYKAAAITLHWILAVFIIGQILGGWYMGSLPEDSPAQDSFELINISLGLTILLFTVARIVVRLTNPPPALPGGVAPWARVLSGVAQFGFYLLMLALPFHGLGAEIIFPEADSLVECA